MKSRSTFYSTGIPTTFNDLGECDEIDRGGVPFAVPFCGYGTVDFGIIPDRMKEDGNQIIVYQPDEVMRLEVRLENESSVGDCPQAVLFCAVRHHCLSPLRH